MKPPRFSPEHPDRLLSCEEAIDDAYNAAIDGLVEEAERAGWKSEEAELAVLSIARNRHWARIEVQRTNDEIERLKERRDKDHSHS